MISEIIADANILFALANPSSATRKIVEYYGLQLISPEYVLEELKRHKEELEEKSQLSFVSIEKYLREKITFVPFKEFFSKSDKIFSTIKDPSDLPYLLLAHHLTLPIWSNDAHFKEQTLIKVYTTTELIMLLS